MISDSDIIAAMTQAPAEGIRLMMAQYSEPVYWHIRRMVVDHEDAQDATQETFVRLFRAFDTRRDDGNLRCWIYTVATHEALRIIGRRRTDVVSLDDDEGEVGKGEEDG